MNKATDRLNIPLPKPVHRIARLAAAEADVSITSWVSSAIKEKAGDPKAFGRRIAQSLQGK